MWQVWYSRDLCRRPRNLGDELGLLWRLGFLRWQVWHFRRLRLDLCAGAVLSGLCRCQRSLGDGLGLSRRGFLRGFRHFRLDLCAGVVLSGLCRCQRSLGDGLGLSCRGFLRGRCGTFGASGSICVQVWYFRAFVDVSGALAMDWGCRAAAFCVAGVVLSGPPRNLGDELGLLWFRGFLRGRRGTFGASGSNCVAGVFLSGPSCMFVCLSICLYVCIIVCMYVSCMYVCLSVCMYVGLYVCMYVCTFVCTFVCLSVCMYGTQWMALQACALLHRSSRLYLKFIPTSQATPTKYKATIFTTIFRPFLLLDLFLSPCPFQYFFVFLF